MLNTPGSAAAADQPVPLSRAEEFVIAGALLVSATVGVVLGFGLAPWANAPEDAEFSPTRGVVLVLLSAALVLARWGGGAGKWVAWPLTVATPAAALFVALRGASTWELENRLVDPETGRTGLHLSLPVAFAVALTAGVLVLQLLTCTRVRRWRRIGLVLSITMTEICVIVAVGRATGFSLIVVNGEPLSFLGALGLGSLNLANAIAGGLWTEALGVIRGPSFSPSAEGSPTEERTHRVLLFAILGTLAVITITIYVGLLFLVQKQRAELALDLTSELEQKARQIDAWRREREGDANVIRKAPLVRETLLALQQDPRRNLADTSVGEFAAEVARAYGYEVVALLDARGVPVWATPANALTETLPSGAVREGLPRATVPFMDELRRDPNGRVWLDLVAPVRIGPNDELLGAVLLRVDAGRRLYPMVREWLTTRSSPEILLLGREADRVLFLSPLRDRANAELNWRLPLASPNLLEAHALRGELSVLHAARDYRGVDVLGVAQPVSGTSWTLVAKMDQSELYDPVRDEAWRAGAAFSGVLLAVGFVGGGFWRRRQFQHARQRWLDEQARHAAMERLGLVMRHANDIILIFDDQMRIVEANERAESAYGWPLAALRGRTAGDIHAPDAQATLRKDFLAALQGGYVFETTHRHCEGREFPVEVSSRPVLLEGRRHVLSIIRDTSERQAHLREIERLNRMYQVVSQVNQTLVRATERNELLRDVCQALVAGGLFKVAWAGWLNPTTRRLMPLAVAGDAAGAPDGISILPDAGEPDGFEPIRLAFVEARAVVSNQSRAAEGSCLPQHRGSVHSVLALPIREGGNPVGVLAVGAAEADFFQAREIALLEEAAGDVSFALDIFARESLRRETAAALATSQRRMEFLLSATPAVLYTRRPDDLALTFVSENVARVVGWSAADFLREPGSWTEQVHPADRAAVEAGLRGVTPGRSAFLEYRIRRPDGAYRWIYDEFSAVADEHGRPREYVGSWSDVTERQEAEHALRERQELLSLVFDQALDSIVLYDLTTNRFAEFNQAAHRNLGYSREEFAQLRIADIDVGLTPEQVAASLQVFSSPGGGVVDTKHRAKDGTIRDVRLGARKITIGGRDYLVTLWSDVTERRKMEEAIRVSEERHRTLFESMDLGVVYHDETGAITAANPAAEHILGLSLEQMQGLKPTSPVWRALREDGAPFPGEDHPASLALRTGARVNGVVMGVQPGRRAEVRWILINAVPEIRAGETKPFRVFAIFNDITARRRAEMEVRKLSTAAEQSPNSIIITDLSGRIEYVNQRFTDMTGYAAGEVVGRNPRFLKSGLTPVDAYTNLWKTILSGQVWRGELVNRRKNGTLFTVSIMVTSVTDSRGQPTHYLAVNEDITDRKRAEAELRQAFLGLQILNQTAGLLERRNLALSELGRVVATALAGLPDTPGAFQASVEIEGERQTAGAEGARLAEIHADITVNERPAGRITLGCVRWPSGVPEAVFRERESGLLENIARTIGLGLGEREAFAAVQRFNVELEDKVSRRTAELASRTREIEALLESIPDMVLRVTRDGSLLECQPAKGTSRLARIACPEPCSAEALPRPLFDAVLASGLHALEKRGAGLLETDVDLAPAGSFAIEVRSAAVGPDDFVAFVRDITDRKRSEAEAAAMLEKEREVSEMKTRFISVTSHEFRTPIAAAMGTVELLRGHLDRIAPRKREEMFARITGALKRMTEMLEDLLQLNRIDAGRTRVQLAPANLRVLLESLVDEARIGDRSAHEFVCRWESESTEVTTDVHLLHHIVSNLLSNAARYSPAGTVITASGTVGPDAVRLTVDDQGIGVPETDHERIFEPFERGSNVGAIAGTGLGLNIVKRMTELLGGRIRVEPGMAGGSRFILELSLHPPDPQT